MHVSPTCWTFSRRWLRNKILKCSCVQFKPNKIPAFPGSAGQPGDNFTVDGQHLGHVPAPRQHRGRLAGRPALVCAGPAERRRDDPWPGSHVPHDGDGDQLRGCDAGLQQPRRLRAEQRGPGADSLRRHRDEERRAHRSRRDGVGGLRGGEREQQRSERQVRADQHARRHGVGLHLHLRQLRRGRRRDDDRGLLLLRLRPRQVEEDHGVLVLRRRRRRDARVRGLGRDGRDKPGRGLRRRRRRVDALHGERHGLRLRQPRRPVEFAGHRVPRRRVFQFDLRALHRGRRRHAQRGGADPARLHLLREPPALRRRAHRGAPARPPPSPLPRPQRRTVSRNPRRTRRRTRTTSSASSS